MNNNELTTPSFWKSYWESKDNLVFEVEKKYELGDLVEKILEGKNIKSAIEIGGFPGYYAILLKKYYQINTTLLDYFVHFEIINRLLEKNNLKQDAINIIQTDLFKYIPEKKYDLVLSCGLIEHFEDTKDVINRHVQFLEDNGTLLITLPNFRGVNGWIQKVFDPLNYSKHNIKMMDIVLLQNICQELGLKEVKCYHYRKFSVWLENKDEKSILTKIFVKTIWVLGKIFTRIVPIESKFLSPYIVLEAKK